MSRQTRTFTRADKYLTVATLLAGERGTVLDVGARDQILGGYLERSGLEYQAADVLPGLDFQVDLEGPLPFADGAFDIVVALDVLEHVERIHDAFGELCRVAKGILIVGLPNFASFGRRWSFFWRGDLSTRKYDLLPNHQGDRHRWLTTYAQINTFVEVNASRREMSIVRRVDEIEGGTISGAIGMMAARVGLLPNGFQVGRCVWMMRREPGSVLSEAAGDSSTP